MALSLFCTSYCLQPGTWAVIRALKSLTWLGMCKCSTSWATTTEQQPGLVASQACGLGWLKWLPPHFRNMAHHGEQDGVRLCNLWSIHRIKIFTVKWLSFFDQRAIMRVLGSPYGDQYGIAQPNFKRPPHGGRSPHKTPSVSLAMPKRENLSGQTFTPSRILQNLPCEI